MKTCLKTGSTERAVGPTGASSVLTSRHPRTRCPSSVAIRSRTAWHSARSRVDFAAAGPAVQQVLQHGERLADDRVRRSALDVHHEADTAGVVLVSGIVETLRGGQAGC